MKVYHAYLSYTQYIALTYAMAVALKSRGKVIINHILQSLDMYTTRTYIRTYQCIHLTLYICIYVQHITY